jgi:pilus assembly protein CpaB
MRGSRLLFIVGAVLIIGAIAVGAIFMLGGRDVTEPSEPAVAEEGTVVPVVPQVKIVVAIQNLARGVKITEEMTTGEAPVVVLRDWPEGEEPDDAITNIEDVRGRITRVDIVPDRPILASMLVEEPLGSIAALQVPEGMVAYALPVARYSSVAWALQPGDYVDMIISLLLVELDEEFQTALPNEIEQFSCDPECQGWRGTMGRLEVLPNGWLVNVIPAEQRPNLVTQLTIQSAMVLQVGDWPAAEEEPAEAPEEPVEAPPEEPAAVEPEPSTPSVAPLTLAVTRQDAMVLEYAQLTGAHITFVLRRVGENEESATTASVTLQYLMDRYTIESLPKLPYGVEPEITSLGVFDVGEVPNGGAESGE